MNPINMSHVVHSTEIHSWWMVASMLDPGAECSQSRVEIIALWNVGRAQHTTMLSSI
jgi:hypothetical protein